MPPARAGGGATRRRGFSSDSSSWSSLSMAVGGSQGFAERGERITIPRGGGVGRDAKLRGDLLEGEFAPDLEHELLALLSRETTQRGLDGLATVVSFQQIGRASRRERV